MKENTMPERTQTKAPATREESRTLVPPVDIFETEDSLVVIADLPGVAKDGVDVRVENDLLTIKASGKTVDKGEPVLREFELHDYYRQFQLGEQIDQAKIAAELKHGVLTVMLPKVEKVKPKKITVKVE
jgi:HSP20 family protein